MEKVRKALDDRMVEITDFLEGKSPSSDEYKKAADNLETLGKLRLEEDRLDYDKEKMYEDISLDRRRIENDRYRNKVESRKSVVGPLSTLAAVVMICTKEVEGSITSKALAFASKLLHF